MSMWVLREELAKIGCSRLEHGRGTFEHTNENEIGTVALLVEGACGFNVALLCYKVASIAPRTAT
jgi:hypothetical protein